MKRLFNEYTVVLSFALLLGMLASGCDEQKYPPPQKVGSGTVYLFEAENFWNQDVFTEKLNQFLNDNPTEKVVSVKVVAKSTSDSSKAKTYLVLTHPAVPGENRPIPSLTAVEK